MARGVTAAGHPVSAQAGADALSAGGNAVDAAIAAMLASFVAEPLLTGLGAGGLMLVAKPDGEAVCLDFFVEAPGRGADHSKRADLLPWEVDFGDATQVFNAGPASAGVCGTAAGIAHASERFGSLPLAELVGQAARLAREGVALNAEQAYVVGLLEGIVTSTDEVAAIFAPDGELLGEGDTVRQPELGDALELLGSEGAAPFRTGKIAERVAAWLAERGGLITLEDFASYEVVERQPVAVDYRGLRVLATPPPSAGGTLVALTLGRLAAEHGPADAARLVEAMRESQEARDVEFLDGLAEPGFADRFLGARLGSTTHISAIDSDGLACAVTCSNGSSSGVVVPGTGIHLNNMLGEQDLNPHGFHRHPPGRRLPSMMTPTVILEQGRPRFALGSAGSNRIRSALVQTVVGAVDRGLPLKDAVEAPRLHWEDGVVYCEPGVDLSSLAPDEAVAEFRAPNLFFGGVQVVGLAADGSFDGAADARRGGAVAWA
ncbi:MAG: gamma-glutamyltransferase [Actinomycetes bacterium]